MEEEVTTPLNAVERTGDAAEAASADVSAETAAETKPKRPRKPRATTPRKPRASKAAAGAEPDTAAESLETPPAEEPALAAEEPVRAADVQEPFLVAPTLDIVTPEALVVEPPVTEPALPQDLVRTALAKEPDTVAVSLGRREVEETGEPVPANRREPRPAAAASAASAVLGDIVLVPEAREETAPFVDVPDEVLPIGLPPITPELLAEVRATAEQPRDGRRGRDRDRDRDRNRPPQPERPAQPLPIAEPGPGLVFVPEALLESVPAEWGEEDAFTEALPGETTGGRGRRRGRGRGRDRGREGQEAPATPAVAAEVAPQATIVPQTGPIILGRSDDDRVERDRRSQEIRTDREYKEILINTGERETRIAVLENGKLVELHVEREERVVGNVCKGRVANVLPGMDAAFVDIGLDRNAFLYVGDILFDDPATREGASPQRRTSRDIKIKDVAKPGQEILVQIVKGPRGTKGARVSTKMSIPGRYLVLMPDGDHLGVSRKIEDPRERDRLKKIADQIQPKGYGLIVRTEAEGRTDQELRQDLDYLHKTWERIAEKNKRMNAPAVIHKDLGIILKTIRDLFGQDVDKLVLDDEEEFEKVVDTLQQLAPDLVDRVRLHEDPVPLFTRYNIEEEIERLLRRKVWLRNGAYLLLDTTEALTTIDVNTGKFVGTSSLAETILKTNMDAVDEIARQLRLRDIGGMIVLDFIDMASARDRALVMRKLEEAFRRDRTRTKIAHISPLGLVEMTRKRTADNVTDVMTHVCPYCQGRGRVWSPETMAIQIERNIQKLCAEQEVDAVLVHANPEVAAWMIGPEGESVERLERMIRRPVYVRSRHDYHIEKFEVMPGDMLEMERDMMPFHGGQIVDARVEKIELITPPRSAAWADGYFVDVANAAKLEGQRIRVRLTDVRRSFALGEPVAPSTAVDKSEPI